MTFPYDLLSNGDRFANWAKKVGYKKHNFSFRKENAFQAEAFLLDGISVF